MSRQTESAWPRIEVFTALKIGHEGNRRYKFLVDGHDLAELMIDYGVGVSTKATFEIKEPDKDFSEEDSAS